MAWMNTIGSILEGYKNSDPTNAPPDVNQHFDTVAQTAPREAMAQGIASAFNSEQTPSFGQMVAQLFSRSDPEQKAGLLSHLSAAGGPGLSSLLATSGLSNLFAHGQVTPEAASNVSPTTVGEIADRAQKQDPSIVDTVSSFYAQHPTLVKTLGALALSIAMSRMSQR
jgi:hypothetical protein